MGLQDLVFYLREIIGNRVLTKEEAQELLAGKVILPSDLGEAEIKITGNPPHGEFAPPYSFSIYAHAEGIMDLVLLANIFQKVKEDTKRRHIEGRVFWETPELFQGVRRFHLNNLRISAGNNQLDPTIMSMMRGEHRGLAGKPAVDIFEAGKDARKHAFIAELGTISLVHFPKLSLSASGAYLPLLEELVKSIHPQYANLTFSLEDAQIISKKDHSAVEFFNRHKHKFTYVPLDVRQGLSKQSVEVDAPVGFLEVYSALLGRNLVYPIGNTPNIDKSTKVDYFTKNYGIPLFKKGKILLDLQEVVNGILSIDAQKIGGDLKTDITAKVKDPKEIPENAKLYSYAVSQNHRERGKTVEDELEIDRFTPGGRARLRIRTSLDSPQMLPIQEYACEQMRITFR